MANGKFVAYYRVSTKAQGASGLGLEAQEAAVGVFVNGRACELVGSFTDVESGTRKGNHRPELAKAIQLAKREKATLLIAKLDRLARNVAFVSNLMESGIEFVACDMPTANKFTIHILAAVAEHEAELISKRTREALAAAKARGVKLGTPGNLTAEAQAKSAATNREKAMKAYAAMERRIANLRACGMSFQAIADQLNADGEMTRTGAAFAPATVKRIIDRAVAAA
ncbi:DNA-invertase hin [compost metagenome]